MTIKREDMDRREIDFSDVTTGQRLPPVHPGEILRDEYLNPMDLNVNRLAQAINVSPTRLYNIVNKKSRITGDIALRLGHYFGMTPEFWINLQTRYDLDMARREINLDIIEPLSIKPSETGCIYNDKNKFDLSDIKAVLWNRKFKNHLQGIAQLGSKYTVLSSSVNDKALILAYDSGNEKKVVQVKRLPDQYDHAGGLGVLDVKNGEDGWMIAVPVHKVDRGQGDKGAILRYFLPKGEGDEVGLPDPKKIISLPTKAYAAGIVRTQDNGVVIAVVVDSDGNRVQFWKCKDSEGQGSYKKLAVWDESEVSKKKRKKLRWIDEKWGGYPNSISLIEHGGQIYFVGMHLDGVLKDIGIGKDWVDIYEVNLDNSVQLKKKVKKQVKCTPITGGEIDGPSFRWGGNARMQNEKLEVLAVGCNVHHNRLIEYNKFEIDMNSINQPA